MKRIRQRVPGHTKCTTGANNTNCFIGTGSLSRKLRKLKHSAGCFRYCEDLAGSFWEGSRKALYVYMLA